MPVTVNLPSGVAMRVTVISFRDSVPVLSLQMTVALPSVSTAGSLRTMALRDAMRLTPMASAIVRMAGRPSGIAETASATDAISISDTSFPVTTPRTNTSAQIRTMTTVITRLKLASRRISGVSTPSTSRSIPAIRPIRVDSPVATTTPAAVPLVTRVPANARLRRSPSGTSPSSSSTDFATGIDSPVKAASSICRFLTRTRRRSAGTLSPALRSTASPGTSSSAGRLVLLPSRRTTATGASMRLRDSMACSALDSWMKPITALTITTPRMTPVSTQCCSRPVAPAVASRT